MIVHLPQVLTREELKNIRAFLKDAEFVDGMQTAGAYADQKKHNMEVRLNSPDGKKIQAIVMAALQRANDFGIITYPRHVGGIIFSCYTKGMFYKDHSDNAIMGRTNPFRSDLAMTIFLNDPGEYDGGELVLDTDVQPEHYKLPAGDAVIYPTFVLHRVNPVVKGERYVALTWIQSMVRSPQHRQVLLDIYRVLDYLVKNTTEGVQHPEAIKLDKVYKNLVRMWAEL